jgi:hypothetical protein
LNFQVFLGGAKNHFKIDPETPEAIFSSPTGPNQQFFCLGQQLLSKPLVPEVFGKAALLIKLIPSVSAFYPGCFDQFRVQ